MGGVLPEEAKYLLQRIKPYIAWPRQLSPLLKRGILCLTIQIMIQGGAQIATGVLQKIGYGKPLGGTVGGITKENILQPKLKRRPSKTT